MVQKRFPSTVSQADSTFLNNKSLDGELYALLQEYSYPDGGITKVKKGFMTQEQICKKLNVKTTKTIRTHIASLINNGYIIQDGNTYILPNKEDIYMLIPLETVKYLTHNCKEHVVKLYIYLGQRYKYAQSVGIEYIFTLGELGQALGLSAKNHQEILNKIKYALELLSNSGLIEYQVEVDKVYQYHILTGWNFYYKKVKG